MTQSSGGDFIKQQTFSDIEYGNRRKRTKREEFFEKMDKIIPWEEWTRRIKPLYYPGRRGRPPKELETMLRMWLIEVWYGLTDEETEDAVYDSYAMRSFMNTDFVTGQVPDASTLRRFRHIMDKNNLGEGIMADLEKQLAKCGLKIRKGSMEDATAAERIKKQKPDDDRQTALWEI